MAIKTKQFVVTQWNHLYWGILYTPDNVIGKVPLIVFNHGAGETGTTEASTSKLYTNGPLKFIKEGWKPNFMILAMQAPSWSPSPKSIDYVLKHDVDILANWDGNNALITGLSAGGDSTTGFMDDFDNPTFSYVPMSPAGRSILLNPSRPHKTWFITGNNDGQFTTNARKLAIATNGKLTEFVGGHCCWNTYYNPVWRENGDSIYDWAFKQVIPPPPPVIKKAIMEIYDDFTWKNL